MIERQYINPTEFESRQFQISETNISTCKDITVLSLFVKRHTDDRILRNDINKTLKILKKIVLQKNIRSLGIIRDLAILNLSEWSYFIDQFNKIFTGVPLVAVFYQNNLPVPPVESRYKLIKEYHVSSIGAHRGINKTYSKIAADYYWRNMRPDVR